MGRKSISPAVKRIRREPSAQAGSATGNRKHRRSVTAPGTLTYNGDDEVSTDSIDNNGNTTHSGANSFIYGWENHLTSMNGGAVALVYDGDGNRVAETSATA